MEAWEELAPEYPPGAPTEITSLGHLPNPVNAWRAFTRQTKITRKAYAELIAPGLVRKAATDAWGEHVKVLFEFGRDWVCIRITGAPYHHAPIEHEKRDICTAALATIKALRGDG